MSCDNELTHGVALFRPVRRETSIYHHSILDTLPVLRRLTLADREDKDYISRQANLAIKKNGVYVVTGTETFEDHPPASPGSGLSQVANNFLHLGPDHPEPPKLRWRFEYMVEDRRGDSGRIMAGEKVLTPLSFSCSPGLLHPSHGKRIRLVHVLMKNMSPKLSAEKLTTTLMPHAETQRPVGFFGSEIIREALGGGELPWSPPVARAKDIIRTLSGHRRTRSSSEPASGPRNLALQGSDHAGTARAASSLSAAVRRRMTRAPSPALRADRWDTVSLPASPTQYGTIASAKASPGGTPGRPSRQILTREELASILSSFPTPAGGGGAGAGADADATLTADVRALSPPSYYRHRRAQSDLGRADELGIVVS